MGIVVERSSPEILVRRRRFRVSPTAIFFALVAIGLTICSFLNGPLSWDGSFYLFEMLDHQTWFIAQHHRWINYVLQAPTLVAMHVTWNIKLLSIIFSLSYASPALIGLLASWFICRRRPALFIWPALGIALTSLPGMFCFNSEATMTAAWFWPVLIATLIGTDFVEFLCVAVFALTMLIIHPNAASVLGFGTITALISALIPPFKPRRFIAGVSLAILTVVRLLIPLTPYEHRQMHVFSAGKSFYWGVMGWPLISVICGFVAAALLLARARGWLRSPLMEVAPAIAILAAGAALVPWALRPAAWTNEMEFRFWMAPLSLVMMGACALDAWLGYEDGSLPRARRAALAATGLVFMTILTLQSLTWNRLTRRLLGDLQNGGCISFADLPWLADTPMNHWSTASYAIDLQGRAPHSLVLQGNGCRAYAHNRTVRIIWLTRRSGEGWFDLDQVPIDRQFPWMR